MLYSKSLVVRFLCRLDCIVLKLLKEEFLFQIMMHAVSNFFLYETGLVITNNKLKLWHGHALLSEMKDLISVICQAKV